LDDGAKPVCISHADDSAPSAVTTPTGAELFGEFLCSFGKGSFPS